MPNVAEIGPQGQHEEQPAQDVLALGHPSHRFDPQRMNREHSGHEGTRPKIAGHPPQNQKEDDCRGHVKQDVAEVMSPGRQPVKLAIQHVGEPSERVPVAGMAAGEGPSDALDGQAAGDWQIPAHVVFVIVVDEVVAERLAEDENHRQQQESANARRQRERSIRGRSNRLDPRLWDALGAIGHPFHGRCGRRVPWRLGSASAFH